MIDLKPMFATALAELAQAQFLEMPEEEREELLKALLTRILAFGLCPDCASKFERFPK